MIIPTLNGRVPGVLRPGPGPQHACLIVLSDAEMETTANTRALTYLSSHCQVAGISVLEVGRREAQRGERPAADPDQLVLNTLGAITQLQSRGYRDIATIVCGGATTWFRLQQSDTQFLARCIAFSLERSLTLADLSTQVASLIQSIHSAVDSMCGVAGVQVVAGDGTTQLLSRDEKGVSRQVLLAPGAADDAQAVRRITDTLFAWALQTLQPTIAAEVIRPLEALDAMLLAQQHRSDKYSASRARGAFRRSVVHNNMRYLQQQWNAILTDLEERGPCRALEVRTLLSQHTGSSNLRHLGGPIEGLRAARLSWRLLDTEARRHWVTAWKEILSVQDLQATPPDSRPEPATDL
jgi:hypothetical protein